MAATPVLITPLPWIEIECANLSLIPHPSPCPVARLSVRNYEYNTFVRLGLSYMCLFLLLGPTLVAAPGSFWIHLSPCPFQALGPCLSHSPLLDLRVTHYPDSQACSFSEPTATPSQIENSPGRGHGSSPALLMGSSGLLCRGAEPRSGRLGTMAGSSSGPLLLGSVLRTYLLYLSSGIVPCSAFQSCSEPQPPALCHIATGHSPEVALSLYSWHLQCLTHSSLSMFLLSYLVSGSSLSLEMLFHRWTLQTST